MGLGNSKPERIPDNFDDIDIIDISEVEEDTKFAENSQDYNVDEIVDNIINDAIKELENNNLYEFKKWVMLDSKNNDLKLKCLRLIDEDMFANINFDIFIDRYSWYYDNLVGLGKTAFDICKCKFTLDKYQSTITA